MVAGHVHTPAICLWVWLLVKYKGPWLYVTAVMILETVQYSFCKSPLELVVVVSICILWSSVMGPSLCCHSQGPMWYFVACHTRSNMWGLVYMGPHSGMLGEGMGSPKSQFISCVPIHTKRLFILAALIPGSSGSREVRYLASSQATEVD